MGPRVFRFALVTSFIGMAAIAVLLVRENPTFATVWEFRPAVLAASGAFFFLAVGSIYFGLFHFWLSARVFNAAFTITAYGLLTAANFNEPRFHVLSPALTSIGILEAFLWGMILTLSYTGQVGARFRGAAPGSAEPWAGRA